METNKISDEFVAFGKGNVEAFVQSSQIWTQGVQALAKTFAESTQAQLDEAAAAVKQLSAAKSIKELLDLQAALTRSSVEKAIAESTRLTEASTKLATDTLAPLTSRLTLASEKLTNAA
jgi:phasin family protein